MNKERKGSVSKKIKVRSLRPALIVSEYTVYEYSMFLKHLLVGLADESIQTALVCPTGCNVDWLVSGAVEIISHPALNLPLMGRRNRKVLARRLKGFEPNLLHCLCESKAALTRWLAGQLNLPYVLAVNSLQKRWRKFPVSSRHCTKIVAPTRSIAADITKAYPAFTERIEQINIGTFVEETVGCFRRPGQLACMVTGCPTRNAAEFDNLFGAVKRLTIDGYEFMLVVIGGRQTETGLRKLSTALGLSQIVTIVPELQPRRSLLAAGDIFIQTAASDAFNPLLLEAMSVGTAVAACKGGVDDLVIEDQTAVVFDPADELSIKASLQRLLDRREFARQLAGSAQDYLRENHTPSGMISAILQTYCDSQKRYTREDKL